MRPVPDRVLDGHDVARRIRDGCLPLVEERRRLGRAPSLVVVRIGDHPAAQVHAEAWSKEAAVWGLAVDVAALPVETTARKAMSVLGGLGRDPAVDGVAIARPLPENLNERALQEAIPPAKDVEGVHPTTLGRCVLGRPGLVPATAGAVLRLVDAAEVVVRDAAAVIVAGPDALVLPAAHLLGRRDADVTLCRPMAADLAGVTRRADILIVEAHRPALVTAEMVKEGAVVIDAGVNAVPDEERAGRLRLAGDVAFEAVSGVARAVTPVPGGVGAVTLAVLLENVVRAATTPGPDDPSTKQLPLFHY